MTEDTTLSPLRRILCSRSNALRVAAWMQRDGISTEIFATGEPLQPWRIVEARNAPQLETRACA